MTTFDLAGWMQASRRFYRDHNLADWERAVPPDARLSPGQDATLRQAEKAGFTRGFAFPPFDLQRAQLDRLIDETARKPAPLPDTQQYAEPFLSDEWSKTPNGRVLQRTDDLGPRTWGRICC